MPAPIDIAALPDSTKNGDFPVLIDTSPRVDPGILKASQVLANILEMEPDHSAGA